MRQGTATMLLGALLWVIGDALRLHGGPLVQVAPRWAGSLVLTIVGERLGPAATSRPTPVPAKPPGAT